MAPFDAACAAVYVHGWAGDRCASRMNPRAMQPTDIAQDIAAVFTELEHRAGAEPAGCWRREWRRLTPRVRRYMCMAGRAIGARRA